MVAAIMFASITGLFVASPAIRKTTSMVYDTLTYRVDHAGFSIYERTSTMRFAAGFLSRCSVIGMGTEGTTKVLSQHFGNTVHVFHFGLVLVAGIPAALLIWTGFGLLIASCFQAGQHPVAIMVICHLLALCSMTLLLTSFQYMPFVIAASVLNYQLGRNEQVADVRLQSARDALFRRRVMPTAA